MILKNIGGIVFFLFLVSGTNAQHLNNGKRSKASNPIGATYLKGNGNSRLSPDSIIYSGSTTFCAGGSVLLTARGATGTIQWKINGNAIPGATLPTYTANATGDYTVTVNGVPYLNAVTVTVNPKPVAGFTFTPNNDCSNVPVHFSNTSTGAVSYLWDFGNPSSGGNNTTNAVSPIHTFISAVGNSPQTFNVKLVATGANGCAAQAIQTITKQQLPDTDLNGTGKKIYNGKTYFTICSGASAQFMFTSNSSTSNSGYRIIWGDGSPDFTSSTFVVPISHSYSVGTWPLLYIVTSNNSCSDTATYYAYVGTNPSVGLDNPGGTDICTGSSLTFPISAVALQNSTGTIYTVQVNDGTPPVTFNHPPPSSVTHIFNLTSCDTISYNNGVPYNNSFTIGITASNPCKASGASVVPIYVSQKPKASFSVSPRDTVCLNSQVTFTNTSTAGNNVSDVSCGIGKFVWRISPATGWVKNSGVFGNDFGLTDPLNWNPGSPSMSITFTTPGVYKMTLLIGANTLCGLDSITKIICVNPEPTASSNVDKTIGCAPLKVTLTSTTNTPNCGVNTYNWTVSYSPFAGCTPSTSGYVFVSGTSNTSANPQILFQNPGMYTISLITISPAGACTSAIAQKIITVKGKPSINLNGIPSNICRGDQINPSANVNNCSGTTPLIYLWDFPTGSPSSSTSLPPGSVTYGTSGTSTITLSATNECGTTNASQTITVNTSPNIISSPNKFYCPGQVVPQFNMAGTIPGATYSWSNSNTSIGLGSGGAGPVIPSFTATNAGSTPRTGTITLTADIGGCTSTSSFTITVNPQPVAPAAVSPVSYCKNEVPTALSASGAANNNLLWYTTPTGGTGSTTAPVPSTANIGSTTYYVSQKDTTSSGCESVRTPINVIVNPIPVIGGSSHTNPTACGNPTGSITLTGLNPNTVYLVTYTFGGSQQTKNLTTNGNGEIKITGLTSGTYTNITVTLSGCASAPVTSISLTDPNPPAIPVAFVAATPLCSGSTLNLSATSTSTGVSFTWAGPNGFSSNPSGTASISNVTTAASGIYSVTATLNGCTSAADTISVVIDSTPAKPVITSINPICSGDTLFLNASTVSPGTMSYSWTGPASFISALQNPFIPNATTAASGLYTVFFTNTLNNCKSQPANKTIIVNQKPAITSTSIVNTTNCNTATGSITLHGLISGNTYTVTYTKNGSPQSITLTAVGDSVVMTGLTSGTYANIIVGVNGCSSSSVGPFTITDPNPPAIPIAVNMLPICSGNTLNLTATCATPNVSFSWTGPNNFASSSTNPSIPNASTAAAGSYFVVASLNGCKSGADTVLVIIDSTPATPIAGSNTPICSGDTIRLTSSTASPGTMTFSWTGPQSFTSNLQNPIIGNATAAASGIYNVTFTNSQNNCKSVAGKTSVVVNPTPVITGSSSTDATNCNTSTGSIILQGLSSNTSYLVNYTKNGIPQTATITANGSGVLTIPSLSSGVYDNITVSANNCTSAPAGPFTIKDPNPPLTPNASALPNRLCSGGTLSFAASSGTPGVNFLWTGPNGFTSSLSNPSIANAITAATGNYFVIASLNGCNSGADTVAVIVDSTPAAPIVNANNPLCATSTLNLTSTTTFADSITYQWTGPGFTSTNANPVIANVTTANSGTYSLVITSVTGNCPSLPASVQVTIYPGLTNIIDTVTQTICTGQQVTIAGQPASGGNGSYTYQWEQSADNITWTTFTGQTNQSITIAPTTTIFLRRNVISNVCTSTSLVALVIVQPPVANNTISANQDICVNTRADTLRGSLPTGANGLFSYQWQQSTDGGATWTNTSFIDTLINYYPGILTDTTLYRRTVSSTLCNGPQSSTSNVVVINVHPDAQAAFIAIKDSGCAPFLVDTSFIHLQQYPQNSVYYWYANNALIDSGIIFHGSTIINSYDSVKIKLKTFASFGCKPDSIEHTFYTFVDPFPAFTASDTIGCGPLTVSFNNNTPNINLFNYFWDFGNGQTSVLTNPGSVIFQPNPTYHDTIYTVKLTITTACKTVMDSLKIRVKSKPKALFSPDKSTGCSPMPVVFTNTSQGDSMTFVWDFGDGSPLNTGDSIKIYHTYNSGIQDTLYPRLISTNGCGSDTQSFAIVISPNPIRLNVAVNGNEVSGCNPHKVHFINNSAGATSFFWSFGDGNFATTYPNVDTITHTYNTSGTFIVSIKAANGCTDTTDFETIKVFTSPIASFVANPLVSCIGDTVHFTNLTDTATGVLWQFGNGGSSTLFNPAYQYSAAGSFPVILIATRQYGIGTACRDTISKTVTVVAQQPGSFTVSDSVSNCVPFAVTFSNQNLPSTLTVWDFGNGIKDTGDVVTHTFDAVGIYAVGMSAQHPTGCKYAAIKSIKVNGPAGLFTYDHGIRCGSFPLRFNVNATGTDSITWNFGDGQTLTTAQSTIYHTYLQPGVYIPSVVLKKASTACQLAIAGMDTIKVDMVKAGFKEQIIEECGISHVSFTDTSRAFSGIQQWSWKFGDGGISSLQNPQHDYLLTSYWTVQQVATTNWGCTDTAYKQVFVHVKNIPVAAIFADSVACTMQPISFTALVSSTDPIRLFDWHLSNGISSTDSMFTYSFPYSGSYTATLIVSTTGGCKDTAQKNILLNTSPIVKTGNDKTICLGQSLSLIAIGADTYSWTPINYLSCNACPNPIAQPPVTTVYEVTGTNTIGCFAKDSLKITVIQPFNITVTGDDTLCIGQSTQLYASGTNIYRWFPNAGLNNSNIANPLASPLATTTYMVIGYDNFSCFTDTAFVTVAVGKYPTVRLNADMVVATGTLQPLTTVVTNGPIAKWLWTPPDNLSCADCPLPVAEIKNEIIYAVKVTTPYGCSASDSISIKVFCKDAQVFIPNMFTPDGDGVNDVFMVRGKGIKSVKSLRIFNRWGELVFEKANVQPNEKANGWDGTIKGAKAGVDVYVYTCEVLCENGIPYTYKGNVAVIK